MRFKEAALETSLSRLVGFINPTQKAIPIRQWPLEADLLALRDNNQIQQLANQLAVDRSNKQLLGYTSVYQIILK